jgi:transposase
MKLVRATIESIVVERPQPTEDQPQGMCLAKGYEYDEVRELLHEFGFTAHIRGRGEEAKEIAREAGKKARRWVVERSHSWMNRFRRILVRWEKKPEHYLAFLHFACALIAFRAAGLLSIVEAPWKHRGRGTKCVFHNSSKRNIRSRPSTCLKLVARGQDCT